MYLGETPSWVTQSLEIGKGVLALKQQKDIQDINTQRLKQGLSPIDASDVAVGAKVSMDNGQLNKILIVSSIALGVILATMILSRRRK